jgi:hypothetical protein
MKRKKEFPAELAILALSIGIAGIVIAIMALIYSFI